MFNKDKMRLYRLFGGALLLSVMGGLNGCGGGGGSSNGSNSSNSPNASTPNPDAVPTATPSVPSLIEGRVSVEPAFPNLSGLEVGTVYATHAGDGSNRLFAVLKNGVIRVFDNNPSVTTSSVFLDMSNLVVDSGEEGLLGLAFDPNYENNGQFYVYYSAASPRRSVIARYQVSSDNPDQADPNSAEIVLEVNQPFENHNGGWISFGPDGFLYIALGDGGSQGDPQGNSQNRSLLLGSLLRIDPNSGSPYSVPADNPFVGIDGVRGEIWAYGFRNPWRCSFDRSNGDLWCADVGQSTREEIDVVEKGGNYGWNIFEGSNQFSEGSADNLQLPIFEYGHDVGQSITGGYVYRGAFAQLQGKYLYGDFVTRRLWMLSTDNANVINEEIITDPQIMLASFAEDEAGEVYMVDFMGVLYRFIVESDSVDDNPSATPNPAALVGGVSVNEYFQSNCATCHGADRQGIIGPNLLPESLDESDQFYFDTIRNGREGTLMQAIDVAISDEEINNIINFLRTPL